jgi:two-component system sensor histidine kinase HydH
MQGFVSDRMLRREAEVTREFLESIIRAEESDVLFERGGVERNPQLASFAHHIRNMPDVLRANIYGPDRTILWSTDAAITGRRFDGNPELEGAFAGELETEIGRISADMKQEHEALQAGAGGLFIEAYIPIRSGNRVAGVVELYKVPNALDAMLRDGQRIIWASTAVGASPCSAS